MFPAPPQLFLLTTILVNKFPSRYLFIPPNPATLCLLLSPLPYSPPHDLPHALSPLPLRKFEHSFPSLIILRVVPLPLLVGTDLPHLACRVICLLPPQTSDLLTVSFLVMYPTKRPRFLKTRFLSRLFLTPQASFHKYFRSSSPPLYLLTSRPMNFYWFYQTDPYFF